MTQRTGSYKLMNIAEDFGVAYGDVLRVEQAYLWALRNECPTFARQAQALEALDRFWKQLVYSDYVKLTERLHQHAMRDAG